MRQKGGVSTTSLGVVVVVVLQLVFAVLVAMSLVVTYPSPYGGILADAKEMLPAFAYLNRSMHPTLVLYDVEPHQRHPSEQQRLQLLAAIQQLEHRRDYLESLRPGALTAPPGPRPTKPADGGISVEEAIRMAPLLSARIVALRFTLVSRFPDPYVHIPKTSHVEFADLKGSLSAEDAALVASLAPTERPLLSMAIISDVQYADREEVKRRHFKLSLPKLQHVVDEIKGNWSDHVDVMLNLGDLVDADIDVNLPIVAPVLQELRQPILHVLGNHDFLGVPEKDFHLVHQKLGMPARYYAMRVSVPIFRDNSTSTANNERKGEEGNDGVGSDTLNKKGGANGGGGGGASAAITFRLVVLDSNDLAVYSTKEGSEKRRKAEGMYNVLKKRRAKNAQLFNGGLDNPQLLWMREQLYEACRLGERVIMLLHHPLRPRGDPTNLWNDDDVVALIAKVSDEANRNNTDGRVAQCVLGVLNGHAHKYLYDFHHSALPVGTAGSSKSRRPPSPAHFITVGGMVQSPFTSWGFVDVFHASIRVHGLVFGRPIDFRYPIGPGLDIRGKRIGRASVSLVSSPVEGTLPYPPELTKFMSKGLDAMMSPNPPSPSSLSGQDPLAAGGDKYGPVSDLEDEEDLHGYWHGGHLEEPHSPDQQDDDPTGDMFWSIGIPALTLLPMAVLGYRCWRSSRRRRVATVGGGGRR